MFDDNRISLMDFGAMSDEGLVEALRRAHGAVAVAQAAEVFAARELYRRRRAENVQPGPDGVRAGEFAVSEVAVALHTDEATAGALIDIGMALEESLPQTRRAFAAGWLDLAKVQVIVDCTRSLATGLVDVVEQRLIDSASRSDPGRLRQTARRWVARVDPGGARRRRELRQDERDVRIRAVQDGMAVFDGLLPAVGAQTVGMRLREMSLQVCQHDPRGMPQRRADALVALADGSGRLRCRCERGPRCRVARVPVDTPRRALVQVGVSAETLLGLRDDPGHLAGHGPIDAALARAIAGHARFQVVPEREASEDRSDAPRTPVSRRPPSPGRQPSVPASGRDLSAGSPTDQGTIRPGTESRPRVSAREIRALDGQCRFPGCVVPGAEAETARLDGLVTLCSRHLRLSTATGWRVGRDGERVRWTAPTGDSHTTTREGARYLFPHNDIDHDIGAMTRDRVGDRPRAEELCFPLAGHVPTHRQLSRSSPEDDLPERR
ncbi:DUF222 domain-containing protein [Nocardia takedensis]